MVIYDYLFYKAYQLAKKSEKWEDTPVFFATLIVVLCAFLNVAALSFLVEGYISPNSTFNKDFSESIVKYKTVVAIILLFVVWKYYSFKGRGERIVNKYDEKKDPFRKIHQLVIVLTAYFLSTFVTMIAAMYKNGDGFFK